MNAQPKITNDQAAVSRQVTIEGRVLAKALKYLLPIKARRTTVPILSHVCLSVDGGLTIEATDIDRHVTVHPDVIAATGAWKATIDAKLLAAIARAAGTTTVEIALIEKTGEVACFPTAKGLAPVMGSVPVLVITVGDVRYDIADTLSPDNFPPKRERGQEMATFDNGRLAASLASVADAMSSEETRYYLCGVCWEREATRERLISTNGHMLLARKIGDGGAPHRLIIPMPSVAYLMALFRGADVKVYDAGPLTLEFVSPEATLQTKLIDGTFPDVDRVIPQDLASALTFHHDQFGAALRQIVPLDCGNQVRAVRFEPIDGHVALAITHPDFGGAVARTGVVWPEASQSRFGFNSRYLAIMLRQTAGELTLRFQDPGFPFLVEDADRDMTRLLMPMRI